MEAAHRQVALPASEITVRKGSLFDRLPIAGGVLGLIFLAASALLGQAEPRQFFASYLVAFLFFISLGLGALIFVLTQYASRAGWSVAVRRVSEHIMGTLPLMAVLSIPILWGAGQLFSWFNPDLVKQDELLTKKEPFLNPGFFYLRSVIYLVAWAGLAWWLRRTSIRQDSEGGEKLTRRLQSVSPVGLLVSAITLTFASFDWVMSLDPHWYSTIFGVYFFSGAFLGHTALLILLILLLQRSRVLENVVTTEHFHDLGKLLFAFVVFWAYIAFSQFMLIWYANIPEETVWYAHRLEHGWEILTLVLALGHFVIPFFFLLSRDVKRRKLPLTLAALWVLGIHYVDLYWLVMPAIAEGFHPSLLDLTTLAGIGGLFFGTVGWLMKKPALVPQRDPRLAESLTLENF